MAREAKDTPILLVVDLQHGLVEGDPTWGPRSTPNLVENVKHLLQTWRSKSWPILHVQHDDIYDSTNPISAAFPETFAIHSSAAPAGDEKVFVKHTGSAFPAEGLQEAVKSYGYKRIVVIGMDGAQCVNSTVRQGDDLGYSMYVVKDACASYGMDDYEKKNVGAEYTHNAAMWMLMAYSKVTSTENVLKDMGY
ncbi:Isochorismatase hydrolase [Hyaloscypha variabilis F]|uniref:Isochorismatase hydrolase n=1 Tax=Hyaloscypha variabilis (strain UAMH 11265 / GT02V1 / F) TaxID=1149755 RepID=A0A2J6RJK1_HYAVF|nr:Isochorismatase hydrolase [Hyaloscypha variabilis F]